MVRMRVQMWVIARQFAQQFAPLVAACGLWVGQAQAAVTVTDDAGHTVTLAQPAQRVVALAPSLTELVYAAGAGGRLVAVSAYSDYPPVAKQLPQVADAAGVSLESLLAAKPDLVLAWKSGNRAADLARIAKLGIPVFALEVARLPDIPKALRKIGALMGTGAAAEQAAARFEERLGALTAAQRGKPQVRAFIEISREPLMTVSARHAIGEALSLCGGVGVFDAVLKSGAMPGAALGVLAGGAPLVFTPSREELFRLQPQVIVYAANPGGAPPNAALYGGLRAWQQQRVYRVDADTLLRPGPRMIEGVAELCGVLDKARQAD